MKRYQDYGHQFARTGMATVGVAAPPTIVIPEEPAPLPEEPSEAIPVSDPRHPQHEAWLLTRGDAPIDGPPLKPFPRWLFVAAGLGVIGMGVYLVVRVKKNGARPLGRFSSYEFSDDLGDDDDLGDYDD